MSAVGLHPAQVSEAGEWLHEALDIWLPAALTASLGLYWLGVRALDGRQRRRPGRGERGSGRFSPSHRFVIRMCDRAKTFPTPCAAGFSRIPEWRWSALAFVLGWLSLAVALIGPVDEGADALLWLHMTQHELLMIVAAPLLVLGRPLVIWLWAVPLSWRRRMVRFSRRSGLSAIWALLTTPVVAWGLHAVALWAWHAPSPYQAAVEHEWLHLVEHACFLGTAIVFWWSLVHGRQGRLGYGAAVAYVFTTAVHSSVLGALLTFSGRPWYPIYASRDTALGWSPLQDQQMAGLLMWVPAGVIFVALGLAFFAAWLGESERRVAFGRADMLAARSRAGREG